jgi:hypothetical protein
MQAWTGPWGSRRFRLPEFVNSFHMKMARWSLLDNLPLPPTHPHSHGDSSRLKCDGTRAERRNLFRLLAKRTSPFKSAGASVQSTTGSRGVRISGSNAEYTMFRGSVKGIGYPLHSPVSPSLPLLCVTECHHISTGLYHWYSFLLEAESNPGP